MNLYHKILTKQNIQENKLKKISPFNDYCVYKKLSEQNSAIFGN